VSSLDVENLRERLEKERERLVKSARYLQQEHPGSMED
jgi:hypothetical protein